jgi:myo-inositol-1(or 4)-monophosphatase
MAESLVPPDARELAIAAARDAGAILRERLTQPRDVQFKGTVDLVTDADRAAEALIAQRIRDAFPDHRLIGEEGARGAEGSDAPRTAAGEIPFGWLVDPLDGTTNFSHGYPHFAVSIALERAGQVVLGAIYDPMRDELFVAERGGGATLNGMPLCVTSEDQLIRTLLATGFPYDLDRRVESDALWDAFNNQVQGVRRDGSAALNLAYVAAGRLDGFWERPLQPWDLAAGSLLVEEAGGRVTGYDGERVSPYDREIVASNGPLHPTMLEIVARHARPASRLPTTVPSEPGRIGGASR